jgi:1,4-dihydroxy-2-naphthoate octaprenyltransferase
LLFFAAMMLFDLTTTAINNYIDTKTNDQTLQFSRRSAFAIILILLGTSTALGLWMFMLTDAVVLLAGGLCFLCGIFYTFGPLPISRQPLGEILSGVFYGLLIPFILLYINLPAGSLLTLTYGAGVLALSVNVVPALELLLFSVIPVCVTANIMLANNTSDVKKDAAVGRHTLPYYLGLKASLRLFAALYYLTYLALIAMVLIRMLPPVCLLALVTLIPVQKNIRVFFEKQDKEATFIVSIKNFIIIMTSVTVLTFAGCLIA